MKFMLCGASDTEEIKSSFDKVTLEFGAYPMSFLSVTHRHENAMTSTSEANSIASINSADICVFVINRDCGHITWEVEFKHTIREGKPFIILCKEKTRSMYYIYKGDGSCPENFQELYNVLYEIEENRHLNLVPFGYSDFESTLRREIAEIVEAAIFKYTEYQRRKNSLYLLKADTELSRADIRDLVDIVTDEYESKKIRKDIILRFAGLRVLDENTVFDLIKSPEQGVSRITLDYLDQLLPLSSYTQSFLNECVRAVAENDDTGAERRLVKKIIKIDPEKGLKAIADHLPLVEIGTKRRIASELIENEDRIHELHLEEIVIPIAEECHKKAADNGWRNTLQAFIDKLKKE